MIVPLPHHSTHTKPRYPLTQATKEQVEDAFGAHGSVKEVKIVKNYGFVEFETSEDAARAKESLEGSTLNGETLSCAFANPIKVREPREQREPRSYRDRERRDQPRDIYRVNVSGLAPGVSWQDLKDFGRTADVDVTYTNVSRDREGQGTVEFRSAEMIDQAVSKLDGTEFKGEIVTLKVDVSRSTNGKGTGSSGGLSSFDCCFFRAHFPPIYEPILSFSF